ncbi:evolutionarily conserved signaling intermediate in Toll pathway, mitochondrial isoform X2 [Erinaceus europaeus]|uniref:Evolutionarily conserved signaling intermediate in Toll pathway, mitochondrial isoform X2 n=1 Tax=Erinaceus europaeus TaxID=9365 RepID=A0ABM3WMF8_ERIEU|nr:evolutionarily conserved signaling intermediate in Toll pathway, mitochondrial isoform X2 [Erinaceus europaeus]
MSWVRAIPQIRGWRGIVGAAFSGAASSQVPRQPLRHIHLGAAAPGPAPTPSSSSSSSLVPRPPVPHEELFGPGSEAGPQDKARFVQAVRAFGQRNAHRRGHVDFIYLALRKMRDFGLERDRAAYHLLLDVFPKDVFRARSFLQRLFVHYPRQQECGVAVLEQMENHGVMPNRETEFLLLQVFGKHSHPMRKLLRMRLWFSRFRAANPFPLPRPLPRDPLRLAGLGLRRLEPDLSARITVYQTPAPPDSTDSTLSPEPDRPHIGSRAPSSRKPWAATTPPGPSSWRGLSRCGCVTSVSTTTCSGPTRCPPSTGWPRRPLRRGTSITRCSWTWNMVAAPGTTMSLTSMKWQKGPCSPCA